MNKKVIEDAFRAILSELDDPNREGLLDTPKRVAKAYEEWFSGYSQNPKEVLGTIFKEDLDGYLADEDGTYISKDGHKQMVILKDIDFFSSCEHHLAPFVGKCHIAYVPKHNVVGLSKLARLVDCFSRRLQVQERMTQQIANAIMEHLDPQGVAVIVEGQHMCMSTRGVKKASSKMITSVMKGVFLENEACRNEFLKLIKE